MSNKNGRLSKFLWPAQNIWTFKRIYVPQIIPFWKPRSGYCTNDFFLEKDHCGAYAVWGRQAYETFRQQMSEVKEFIEITAWSTLSTGS